MWYVVPPLYARYLRIRQKVENKELERDILFDAREILIAPFKYIKNNMISNLTDRQSINLPA